MLDALRNLILELSRQLGPADSRHITAYLALAPNHHSHILHIGGDVDVSAIHPILVNTSILATNVSLIRNDSHIP